jgi:uncharacterized protein YicC (UPF0701 family)
MTGFGRGEATQGRTTLIVEARSVNHRFCEVRAAWPRRLGLPPGFGDDVVKRTLQRGRVEINGVLSGDERGESLEALAARLSPLLELRDRLDPGGPVPWAVAPLLPTREPELPPEGDGEEAMQCLALDALEAALAALDGMRAREGAALAMEMRRLVQLVRVELSGARQEASLSVDRARERLRERVSKLLEGHDLTLDSGRIEVEIALLADRSDVTEELVRLDAHVAELEAQLDAAEPVGRRLDFLLQEMHREVNTLGAKSADGKLSRVVVELKALLEKLREQAQNVL